MLGIGGRGWLVDRWEGRWIQRVTDLISRLLFEAGVVVDRFVLSDLDHFCGSF